MRLNKVSPFDTVPGRSSDLAAKFAFGHQLAQTLTPPVQLLWEMVMMKSKFASFLIAACAISTGATATFNAYAQSEVSALSAVSALPVASVVVSTSALSGALLVLPVALSSAGASLVVTSVVVTARGTLYVLERTSDGATASIEVLGKAASGASMVVGSTLMVSTVGAGVLLSAAGEVVAFIPNALGRSLMHNECVTL